MQFSCAGFAVIAAFVLAGPSSSQAHPLAPTAVTKNGTYVGQALPELSQEIFLGVPFALAPRLRLAQSLNSSWTGTHPAVEFGLTCSGFGTNPRENWPVGEDCLNLNVARPEHTHRGSNLPVLVWIYGGGFRQGAIRDPEFNISYMVQTSIEIHHPVIVVAINYRLSGFGFLGSNETVAAGVSNLGLRDQWKALEWIKENIHDFGGNPEKVTIWGESAGGASVSELALAYGGVNSGLFRGGIVASGNSFGLGPNSVAAGQAVYNNITNVTGCFKASDSLQCLRDLPFDILNTTFYGQNEGQSFSPIIDGDFFRTTPTQQFHNGHVAPINLIIGCNSDEGLFVPPTTANTTTELALYMQAILGLSPSTTQTLLNLYPITDPAPPYSQPLSLPWIALNAALGIPSGLQTRRAFAILGDYVFHSGRRLTAANWTTATATAGRAKAYSYRFDTDVSTLPLVLTPGLGVGFSSHGAELSFEFRLPYKSPTPYPPLPKVTAMQRVSYAMQAQWISFAAMGDPNGHGLEWVPEWPAYDEGAQNFVFNATLGNVLNLHVEKDDYRKEGIAFFNRRWV